MVTIYNTVLVMRNVGRSMDYEAVWKVLEEIVIELRKKGVNTPSNVMNNLKSAKILIKVQEASESDGGETAPKIEQYLGSIEAYLVTEAQNRFPPARIDSWLKQIEKASCGTCQTYILSKNTEKAETRFITGVPRDQKWVRVKPLSNLPGEKLKQLAQKANLSFREEQDGHLIFHGNGENIKKFVKMTTQITK